MQGKYRTPVYILKMILEIINDVPKQFEGQIKELNRLIDRDSKSGSLSTEIEADTAFVDYAEKYYGCIGFKEGQRLDYRVVKNGRRKKRNGESSVSLLRRFIV